MELYLFACLIEITIQIILLIKLKKKNTDWYLFLGINIGIILTNIIAYNFYEGNCIGLGNALTMICVCGFITIINIILLIIGLIIKHIIKNKTKESLAILLKSGLPIIIINTIILFIIPMLISKIYLNKGEKYIKNYLENKYGKSNYEIVKIYKEYNSSGMWDNYLSGYFYEIKSDYMKNTFIINIDENISYINGDYFLPVYYSEKNNLKYKLEYNKWNTWVDYNFDELNNYIIEKTNIKNIKINPIMNNYLDRWDSINGPKYHENYYIISDKNGRIPSLEETINLLIEYEKGK